MPKLIPSTLSRVEMLDALAAMSERDRLALLMDLLEDAAKSQTLLAAVGRRLERRLGRIRKPVEVPNLELDLFGVDSGQG